MRIDNLDGIYEHLKPRLLDKKHWVVVADNPKGAQAVYRLRQRLLFVDMVQHSRGRPVLKVQERIALGVFDFRVEGEQGHHVIAYLAFPRRWLKESLLQRVLRSDYQGKLGMVKNTKQNFAAVALTEGDDLDAVFEFLEGVTQGNFFGDPNLN
jgi:hypothetical protein